MDNNIIQNILNHLISSYNNPNNDQRKASENELEKFKNEKGIITSILMILENLKKSQNNKQIIFPTTIYLKNVMISKLSSLDFQELDFIKNLLISHLFTLDNQSALQISICIKLLLENYVLREKGEWKIIIQTFFENMEKGNMTQSFRCVDSIKQFTKAVLKNSSSERNSDSFKVCQDFLKNQTIFIFSKYVSLWNKSTQNFANMIKNNNIEKEMYIILEATTREMKRLIKHFFVPEQFSNKNILSFFHSTFFNFLNYSLDISQKHPNNPITNVSLVSIKLIINFQNYHSIPFAPLLSSFFPLFF
eukprot:TRINITY_DN10990_c0_g1_i1.p1 TRINITY_DN10990_c0_g1~~TRINITY_DN10990_c0_g1_i1.p1  ORF type:complete len:305 (+),score=72.76 TRINITY_DN10990_c0_g1_i1:47-961(+)